MSAGQANQLVQAVDSLSTTLDSGVGLGLSGTPNGLQVIDHRRPSIWARITGVGGYGYSGSGSGYGSRVPYSWIQVADQSNSFPDGTTAGSFLSGSLTQQPAYEVNGSTDVPVGTKVRMWPSPSGEFWAFDASAAAAASASSACFHARVTSVDTESGEYVYTLEEIRRNAADTGWEAVPAGRTGVAYRAPSTVYDPPPIPVGQAVWACPAPLHPGVYEITSWGGQRGYAINELVRVRGYGYWNPESCGEFVIGQLHFFRKRRVRARDICRTVGVAGESETDEG